MVHPGQERFDPKGSSVQERLLGQSVVLEAAGLVFVVLSAMRAGSLSLYADTIKESIETLATAFSWLTLRQLRKYKHQFDFGLGKIESMLSLLVAGGLLASGVFLVKGAWERFLAPQPLADIGVGVAVNLGAIAVDGWFLRKLLRANREQPSPVISAKAESYALGIAVSVILAATLLAGKLLQAHPWALMLDPVVSLGFALYLLWSVYRIMGRALGDLSDRTLEEALQLVIMRELAGFFNEYEQIHGIRSRRAGGAVEIELHLEFHPDRSMGQVHDVTERMRASLQSKIQNSRVLIIPARRSPS